MKEQILRGLAALLALLMTAGCGNAPMEPTPGPGGEGASGKPVINFEGVVTEAGEESVTLKDGTVVLITGDTAFAGDEGMGTAVSRDILVGNFIQGYTEDDATEGTITADTIWTNQAPAGSKGGKRAVNFEGRVTQTAEGSVTLDSGKVVYMGADTVVEAARGMAAELAVGSYIQGYAKDAAGDEFQADYILITVL